MSIELGEDLTTHTLTEVLGSVLGQAVRVTGVRRRPCEFVTLFPAEILSVSLNDGRELSLFLKHLGSEQSDHPDKQRRDREVRLYENLFRETSGLPVPTFFGARWGGAAQRYELYLQYIDDWSLQYHELTHWFTAAARLADLHAHFARDRQQLLQCDFLLRLDETYFQQWAERAVAALASDAPVLAADLAGIVARYGPAAHLLGSQPLTLVHNDLAPKNVIAARTNAIAPIYFIDWELAGVGCGLLDLVHLKYGLDPENSRRMIQIYRDQLRSAGLLTTNEGDFQRLLAACELHKTLYRLAHSPRWHLPPDRIRQWVGEAEAFLAVVRGARS